MDNPNLKENYSGSKKKRKIQRVGYADGGLVGDVRQAFINAVQSGPAISKAPMEGVEPESDPLTDLAGGTIGAKLGQGALDIIGNEVGAVGKNVVQDARLLRAKNLGFNPEQTYYHGSPNNIEQFDPNKTIGDMAGFFTKSPKFANSFTGKAEQGSIYPVNLSVNNPFDYENASHVKQLFDNLPKSITDKYSDNRLKLLKRGVEKGEWVKLEKPEIVDTIKALGFDGMHVAEEGEKNIAVFKPNQIRSKFADFDPKNKDSGNISYADGGEVRPQTLAPEQAQPDGFVPDHQFTPDVTSDNPQADAAAQGWQQTGQLAAQQLSSGPAIAQAPMEGVEPESSPLELLPYEKAPSMIANAIANGVKSEAFRGIVGNQIGSIGKDINPNGWGAIQKLQTVVNSPFGGGYTDKVSAAQQLLAKAEQGLKIGLTDQNEVAFARQKLKTAMQIATKNERAAKGYAEGGEVSAPSQSGVPQGFIPDSQFVPDQESGPMGDNQAQMQTPAGFIPDHEFEADEDKYGSPEQLAKTAVEGLGEGFAGPLSPLAEKGLGVDPKAMRLRQETNPLTHGVGEAAGFIGSLFTGTGEAGLVAKAGEAVTKAAGFGLEKGAAHEIAAQAVKAAAETALLQSGDEVSKMIKEDPSQSLQTAAASVGLSALLGGVGGAALGSVHSLWKATAGDKLGQVAADFKGRMNEHLTNPDPVGRVVDELGEHYKNITSIADDVYGATGLKAQDIAKAMPELNQKMFTQATDITNDIGKTIEKMNAKPNAYPSRLSDKLGEDLKQYTARISHPDASAADIFDATQELKQQVQTYAKYDKFVKPVDEAYDFVKQAKSIAKDLRTSLEDSDVWGKAAERQKAINGAFSDFQPALKDFEKKFTTEVLGEKQIDPGKVNTYLNQIGKPSAEIKQDNLRNFLDASDKYNKVIGDTHANLGIDSPITPSSLSASRATLKEVTPGAKLADLFIQKGLTDAGGKALGASVGGAAGHMAGQGGIGAFVGAHVLGPFFSSVLPAIAKPLLTKDISATGMKSAMDYALAVAKGDQLITKAASGVFKEGTEVVHPPSTDKDRLKLAKQLEEIRDYPEALMKESALNHYMPDHNMAMASTSANAVNYLNSLRPDRDKGAPLDSPKRPSNTEKAAFNQALIIADKPLTVLQKIKMGTLTPQDVQAIQAIYPDLYKRVSQKLVQHMTDHIAKKQSIPYKTRIGLSMFLAQPLDSTLSPSCIQAAQPINQQASSQKAPQHIERNTSSLGKSNKMYMTPQQASDSAKAKHNE